MADHEAAEFLAAAESLKGEIVEASHVSRPEAAQPGWDGPDDLKVEA
jgi:hypothetical protein